MTTTIQPDVVGRYRITERLCRKSESSIIRARNPENGAVLVKIINPDNTSLQRIRLQYEYQLLQSILLGGVARPLELIDEPGCLAMVLRDFPGESLDTILNRQRLGLSASLAIAGRLASTLDAMHAVHIVHKDISPSSILIASNHEICLMDFRLAARGTASTIDPLTFGGDLSYISPEQTGRMNRGVDYRTDLYSLGMTLYRMLSGQLPFQASDPLEWMHCHVARLPRPLHETAPELPRILSDIVMKLLQKMAEDRYQSARSLQYDLERCLEQWETNAYIEPFDLGTQGLSEQFQIPQRLYGRESEIAQLQAAFERMAGSSGQPELVWVAGDSGSGKSSLVRQWHKQVLRTQGLFIAGKAEQYKPHIPYAIVVDALRELVRQILAEPEDSIIKWKTQLQAALGTNGQLMVDMIPQLALIVGSQPDVPALPSLETKNRFRHVFGRLIRLFAIHAHPLVLFLDDLQWVDAASLDLIAHLLARTETCYLMLIASYRDNEVAAGHPLAVTKEAVNQVIAAREIHLGALPDGSLLQLLTETLHCEQAKASPLAALIRHKTSGNPFFINRFLNALHRDGLIVFDNQASSWDWDIRRIEAADVTDNVVELMARQISAMAADSQDVLRLAACLGYRFSLERVARLAGLMPSDLAGQIESAVQRGFLLVAQSPQPVVSADRQRSYRWAHDRILQAAYSLIADDQRAAIHAAIGRQLLAETPLSGLADELFDIVNHLNLGAAVIADHTERNKLAELNLMAAKRAKRSAAYAACHDYAVAGVALLPDDAWQHHYPMALALHLELIEITYILRHPDQAESLLDQALVQIRSDIDRAALLRLRVLFATVQCDYARGMRVGLDALHLLGVDLPASADEWAAALQATLERIDAKLADVQIEDLLERPVMTEPARVAAADLLYYLMTPGRTLDARLYSLLVATLVDMSLSYGHTGTSAPGYGAFGFILYLSRQDLDRGRRLGKLARQLVEKLRRPELSPKVNITVCVSLDFWYEPLDGAIDTLEKGFDSEIEYGDQQYAGFILLLLCLRRLQRGERLDRITDALNKALAFAQESGNDFALQFLHIVDQFIAALRGQPPVDGPPVPLSVESVVERAQNRTDFLTSMARFITLQQLVLFGAFDKALRLIQGTGTSFLKELGYKEVEENFYLAVASAASYDLQDEQTRRNSMALLQEYENRLAGWEQGCRANFAHLHLFLSAESARLKGLHAQAVSLYDQTSATAAELGFIHIQGLAAERAASACEACGYVAQAIDYLKRAREAYAFWGAEAKVAQLDAHTERLQAPSVRTLHITLGTGPEQLDFLSAVKAFQAISGEITEERLLDTLMRVVIENAGAQKAYLILPDETGLLVIAEARVEGQNVYVDLPRRRVGHTDVLPESILNYVRRSHEQVLLADAGEAHPFSTDAYLNRQRPKSLLCLPLLRQTRLIGLLYLENNLITHAFPPGRLALLDLLASQAAISLENARLYTDLQEREARIRRLVESNIIGIFFWNLDGSISEANQAFLQISGYSRHDLLAGAVTWTEITPPEYRAADQRAILELRQAGTCSPYEKEFIRKDGIRIPILVGAALNAGSDDTGVAFVLDLTARRQSEEERAARKSAEAANEAKSAFLATMSHELRSPLNTMLGFGRLLEREAELPLNVREDLRIMLRSGEHLRTLINQVLDMAKIEAGRLVLNETSFDLHFLLEELEDTFALQAVEKGLSLNVELGQTPRFIRGDPVKLRQVLVNLVSNALKFTTQGEVALRAALLDTAAGLCLRFVVTDTGPGIGAAELDRLFIPFVQTGTGQRTPEGTGLGLAISRNFVHLMGGEIDIDSVPGQGTAVRFDIPLQTIGAPAMAVSAAQPRLRVAALAPGQQRFRILAVDDRADARQLLVRLLTPVGFEVREAANGQEAVDISNEWHPHLIWMDMRMPVLDGRTAARRIKTSPEGRAAVIVALTASSFEEERSDILAAGCDDFLRKPVQEEDLFALMEKHLGVRFVYEVEPVTVPAAAVQVGAAALATLPAGLRAALERALVRLDADAIAGVIAEVPNASLAHSLQVLANEFEYGRILEMLRDAGGKETT